MEGFRTAMLGFLLSLLFANFTEAEYVRYKDPKRPVLSRMTLDEKIGQMVQIERKVASADVMKNNFIDWEGIDRITSPPHANYTYSVQAGVQAGIYIHDKLQEERFLVIHPLV